MSITAKVVERIAADVSCAFVTFQYSESMARCVEDYQFWEIFPFNFLYCPHALKLNGKRIRVIHAPEPDELIWENLEVKWHEHEILHAPDRSHTDRFGESLSLDTDVIVVGAPGDDLKARTTNV